MNKLTISDGVIGKRNFVVFSFSFHASITGVKIDYEKWMIIYYVAAYKESEFFL